MEFHICPRCRLVFDNPETLQKHLNKKRPCKDIYNGYKCPFCNKDFNRSYHLKRHIQEVCIKKVNDKNNNLKLVNTESNNSNTITVLQQLLEKMIDKKDSPQIIQNNNTNNNIQQIQSTTNNINCYFGNDVLPFGKEDLSLITDKKIINMLKIMEIEEIHNNLIKLINFNNNLKKNHNVIIHPKNKKFYLIYEYDRDEKKNINNPEDIDGLTEKYIKRNIDIIEDKISFLKEKNNLEILKIEKRVEKYNDNTDKLINYYDGNYEDKETKEKIKKIKNNVEKIMIKKQVNS